MPKSKKEGKPALPLVQTRSADSCLIAAATASSVNWRLTPFGRQPNMGMTPRQLQGTSAETNVLSVASHLHMPTYLMTGFIKGNPDSHSLLRDFRGRGMTVDAKWFPNRGPWGPRHIMNKADAGFGGRRPVVANDRSGEVGALLCPKHFDLEDIFGLKGVRIVHISGLFAAISPKTGKLCLAIAKAARKHRTKVVFDLNHRASFWKDREEELHKLFKKIASLADVLMGNEEDFQLCLGIAGPKTGGKGLSDKIVAFKKMIANTRKEYPKVQVFATTLRKELSANEHLWGGIMWSKAEDKFRVIEPRLIQVKDRIGGGDGFAGGLIYGILQGWAPKKCLQFAWATGAYVATLDEDYFTGFSEDQILAMWHGDARVKR